MHPWALVTPASRGIGLALARRLLQTTTIPIVATARKNLDETRENLLTGLNGVNEDRLKVLHLDVLDESSIAAAAEQTASLFPQQQQQQQHYLHLAFAIPGILVPEKSPAQISAQDALRTFQINVLGPMLLIKHFSPFLPKKSTALTSAEGLPSHATWAAMSARVGSISDNRGGGWYSYRSSKAALNQVVKSFDIHLRANAGGNAMAVGLHPGTVKTGLSEGFWESVAEEKLFSPDFTAEKLVGVVNGLQTEQRGRCWDWKGEEILP